MKWLIVLLVFSVAAYFLLRRPWGVSPAKKPEQHEDQGDKLIESSEELSFQPLQTKPRIQTSETSSWGSSTLVCLPRSPKNIYSYWDFNLQGENEFHGLIYQHGHGTKAVLRIFQVVDKRWNPTGLSHLYDVGIDPSSHNWYVDVPHANASYQLELGVLLSNGHFIPVLTSATVTMPRETVSAQIDPNWMPIPGLSNNFASESILSSYDLWQNHRKD